jgi:hypothetical protein
MNRHSTLSWADALPEPQPPAAWLSARPSVPSTAQHSNPRSVDDDGSASSPNVLGQSDWLARTARSWTPRGDANARPAADGDSLSSPSRPSRRYDLD